MVGFGLPACVPLHTPYAFLESGIWIFGTTGLESKFRWVRAPVDGFMKLSLCVLENYCGPLWALESEGRPEPSACWSWLFVFEATTFDLLFYMNEKGWSRPFSSSASSSSFGCMAIYDEFNLDLSLISCFDLSSALSFLTYEESIELFADGLSRD